MNSQTHTQTEDKILNFIDGPLTKFSILLVMLCLLALIIYNGLIQGGFNSASWGL